MLSAFLKTSYFLLLNPKDIWRPEEKFCETTGHISSKTLAPDERESYRYRLKLRWSIVFRRAITEVQFCMLYLKWSTVFRRAITEVQFCMLYLRWSIVFRRAITEVQFCMLYLKSSVPNHYFKVKFASIFRS